MSNNNSTGRRMEKITESLKLHLPESMLRDLQDEAMRQDRAVSELGRHILALYLYGTMGRTRADGYGTVRGDEGRT